MTHEPASEPFFIVMREPVALLYDCLLFHRRWRCPLHAVRSCSLPTTFVAATRDAALIICQYSATNCPRSSSAPSFRLPRP
jgi:hypothetical protein